MTADLVARLEVAAENWPTVYESDRANVALLREAASALRSSGEAVAWRFRDNVRPGMRWFVCDDPNDAEQMRVDGGYEVRPLYLHPATVTDEDVERACIVMSRIGEDTEWPADYDGADQAAIRHFMRAALESFVRPTPPASTKGG